MKLIGLSDSLNRYDYVQKEDNKNNNQDIKYFVTFIFHFTYNSLLLFDRSAKLVVSLRHKESSCICLVITSTCIPNINRSYINKKRKSLS